ncbi:calcium/sodium antiporter [Reichenbachiella agarivorans]|uniref:Calcium/sodium antiporter n=1 Tax=Reichenbachiella agarivorans TaxID=2979464 RepID=A0ABY6CKV7_9BACT|nr:calcium/sodium antiporter [Reichenbachiella agarivorans]UXP31162.1 calcium/sodium antiporter [Reichenbachiella agarivorans]
MIYVLFLLGFVLLIKGADVLVEGASSVAKRYNIPELVIGLTIVSFGTSMPELIVNLLASFDGSSELAIGNVFGSNIANVLLILGVSAIIRPLPIQKSIYFTEIPISLVATFMVGFLANADLFVDVKGLSLSRIDGAILLFFFGMFMAYIFVISRSKDNPEGLVVQEPDIVVLPKRKSILYVILGSFALFLGGKWVVDGAIEIALHFGLSETFIGLTVVAIGTSLPELVTSAVAAKKGQADMAVGNVIGSNIFNLLWILGVSAMLRPLPFDVANNSDIMMVILASTMLILAVIVGKKTRVDRWEGVVFLVVYFGYLTYLVMRG